MKLKNIIFPILSLFFISCEKELNLKLSDSENLLVVNSVISPDKPISFKLSRSISVLEKDTVISVEKAKIDLFCNNTFIETDTVGNKGVFLTSVYPLPDKIYSVKINSPNLPPVTASLSLPNMPIISSIQMDSVKETFYYSYELTTYITDNLEQKDYYLISLQGYKNMRWNNPAWVDVPEYLDFVTFSNKTPVLNEVNTTSAKETVNLIMGESNVYNVNKYESLSWMAFSNEYFTPNFHEIKISTGNFTLVKTKPIYILLSKISEDYFKYLKSIELNKNAGNSEFSEPVPIFNNINGGIGIFGGMTTTVDSVLLNP